MPSYKRQFGRPEYYDHDIEDRGGKKFGTIRVKPGSIAWKPARQRKFRSVSLDNFVEWISKCSEAKETKS